MTTVSYHRRPRSYPDIPSFDEVSLALPPTKPTANGSQWIQQLLGGVVGFASFGFIIAFHPALILLILVGVMGFLSIGVTIFTVWQQRIGAKRVIERQRTRYREYLDVQSRKLEHAVYAQRTGVEAVAPEWATVFGHAQRRDGLWERRPSDDDFGDVRLGVGVAPHASRPSLDMGNNPLVEYDQKSLETAEDVVRKYQTVAAIPIVMALTPLHSVSLAGNRERADGLVRSLMCRLAADQAPQELRFYVYTSASRVRQWEWVKWMPHARSAAPGDVPRVFIESEPLEFSRLVGEALSARPRTEAAHLGSVAAVPLPYLVIIIDDYRVGARDRAFAAYGQLLSAAGVTVLHVGATETDEPPNVNVRMRITPRGLLDIEEVVAHGQRQIGVTADAISIHEADVFARSLAPIEVSESSDRTFNLTDDVTLSSITPLLPSKSVAASDAAFLTVPLGRSDTGDPIHLDLKESAAGGMGPHGIIIGATGSGKSELLRTIVTGLATAHSPELVNFVFVDFKGGAAFADLGDLPHAAGMITNLQDDLSRVDRAREALYGEMERRQTALRLAGNIDNIAAYQVLRSTTPTLPPLPSLLVIVDEFAELLATRPDFVDLFVAIGRLGRSLGVHLMLSSQRLDAGRLRGLEGHLRFRLCLRTFSAEESSAVLGSADAYNLPSSPGVGYLKVDTTTYVRFKSARVTAGYVPDSSEGEIWIRQFRALRRIGNTAGSATATQTEMGAVLSAARQRYADWHPHRVWLEPLASDISLSRILDGSTHEALHTPIGFVDRPRRQSQDLYELDLTGGRGHVAIVGAPQTGKSTFLRTIIESMSSTHSSDDIQFYCIDLGGGTLFGLTDLPHVGAVAGRGDIDTVSRIVRQLQALLTQRDAYFARSHIDSMDAYRAAGIPSDDRYGDVFLVIDNWAQFRQLFEPLEAAVADLVSLGLTFGVHVILSTFRWADFRPAMRDKMGNRFELRLNDPVESDLSRELAAGIKAQTPGRGIAPSGELIQVARSTTPLGPDAVALGDPAPPIKLLPTKIGLRDLKSIPHPSDGVVIGIEETGLEPLAFPLLGVDAHLIVFGDGATGKTTFLRSLASQLLTTHVPDEVSLVMVDYRRHLLDIESSNSVCAGNPNAAKEAIMALREKLDTRMPSASVSQQQLRTRSWWTGPEYVVLVDDYDVVATGANPLAPLAELLPHARDVGLHVILTRRVGGAARSSFEPFFQRLKEMGASGLLLSGDPQEGVLMGTSKAMPLPPGRGLLVRSRRPSVLIQTLFFPVSEE